VIFLACNEALLPDGIVAPGANEGDQLGSHLLEGCRIPFPVHRVAHDVDAAIASALCLHDRKAEARADGAQGLVAPYGVNGRVIATWQRQTDHIMPEGGKRHMSIHCHQHATTADSATNEVNDWRERKWWGNHGAKDLAKVVY